MSHNTWAEGRFALQKEKRKEKKKLELRDYKWNLFICYIYEKQYIDPSQLILLLASHLIWTWLIMENHGSSTTDPAAQPIKTSRIIVLFPQPFQGHINPMLQLANILHTHGGFKITIIHTEYNSPNPSNYPHFAFKSIKDRFSEIADQMGTNKDPTYFLRYLNTSCVDPFRECLARLLKEESVACVITDAGFYFTQAVAEDLKIPRIVLRTSSLGCVLAYDAIPFNSKRSCFNLTKQGWFHIIRLKSLLRN